MNTGDPIGDVARDAVGRLERCVHRNVRMVWTEYSTYGDRYQRPQLRNYCDDCCEYTGGALKHSLAEADTPTLTREEAMRGLIRREENWRQREIEREQQRQQWFADHAAYLGTPEWASLRKRVLERDGFVCQGCHNNQATQVHHLTYRHWCNEFLWELVAVCRDCHERVHGQELRNDSSSPE